MKVHVAPRDRSSTHHISLSDGQTEIGLIICDAAGKANSRAISRNPANRTAMKTTAGETRHEDFLPPWSPVAQEDWSGGRGNEDFETDRTRFMDNYQTNTGFEGRVFLGPQPQYLKGITKVIEHNPGSMHWVALLSSSLEGIAVRVQAAESFTATDIAIYIKRKGWPAGLLTIEVCSDSAGAIGTTLETHTISTATINDVVSVNHHFTSAQAFVAGTYYWLKITAEGTDADHWLIGTEAAAGTTKQSVNGSTWTVSAFDLYYRIFQHVEDIRYDHVTYRGAEYVFASSSAAFIKGYILGTRGVADDNALALHKLIDITQSWATNAFVGNTVKLIRGKGINEKYTYRYVESNATTELICTEDWILSHDPLTTEYVVLDSDTLYPLTLSLVDGNPITSVAVINDNMYLCRGDATNIRRVRHYNNAGTMTLQDVDDGTNKAVFLCTVRDNTGAMSVWRAQNQDTNGDISVSKSSVVAWADLSFATPLPFKDPWGKINSLKEYNNALWIMREGTVYAASGTITDEIKLDEIHTMMEGTNGIASMVSNAYLYFTLGAGVERYIDGSLADVGPNRDMGMPADRQGFVSAMLAYPGRYLVAINGGKDNYSSILLYTTTGGYEIYRAPKKGRTIDYLHFQAIPGTNSDRLYFNVGSDIVYIPFPSSTIDPTRDPNYHYVHEGSLTGSYIYSGLADSYKFYKSLRLFTENLEAGSVEIEADYRLDDNEEWISFPEAFTTSPIEEQEMVPGFGVKGRRLQWRLRFLTSDSSKSPILKTAVVENLSIVAIKYVYGFQFRVEDNDINLQGESDDLTADEKLDILDQWAADITPLRTKCIYKRFHDKCVWIDPSGLTPLKEFSEAYAPNITATEA